MPRGVFNVLFPAYILAAGVYLIFGEHELATQRGVILFKRVAGLAAAAVSVWMLVGAGLAGGRTELVKFAPYSETAFAAATTSGRPVMIDFYADWCAACVELDEKTFSDARVATALEKFAAFKADNTKNSEPAIQALMQRFQIKGLPTVVFVGADGQEIVNLRLEQFEAPELFVKRVEIAANPGSGPVAQVPR
jgi:thiol:disulfide interchange protein DsbD